jgi:uncharacterized membrane-anchored protein
MLGTMKATLKPYVPLIALVAIALFPFGWLTHLSPIADRLGDFFFPNEAAHAVGHALIFAAIGAALLVAFPGLRSRPVLYFAVVLAVALGQEAFQLLYKRRPVVLNDLTDIGTDLVAAALVMAMWYRWSRERRRRSF